MKKIFALILPLLTLMGTQAQNPAPAESNQKKILLTGATLHIGDGTVIENGAIGFEKNKITFCGKAGDAGSQTWDTVIVVKDRHIYPGLIACNTVLGLNEIEAVRSTNDYMESGEINPSARALIAYNTDSKVTPTVRSNGVLMAQIVPQGGIISGTSSIMMLDGWNWEDASYKADDGLHLNWPSQHIIQREWAGKPEEQKEKALKKLQVLETFLTESKAYCASDKPEKLNMHFESMRDIFSGKKKIFVHTSYVKDIRSAIRTLQKHNIRWVLVDGTDAWMVADDLKKNNVPVVLRRTHILPERDDEDTDLPYKTAKLLKDAGVTFCLSMDGFWQVRNLPFIAGTAAAFGLTKEEALQSITWDAARILGIDQTTGKLAAGLEANIVVSEGDLLDMRSNKVTHAFIRGASINLDNIQTQLYQKYMHKYRLHD